MNQRRIRNHFVPEHYLRGWAATGSEKVWVYKTLVYRDNDQEWDDCVVAGIGYIKRLYVYVDAGKESDKVEIEFAGIENKAAPVLRKIVSDRQLSQQDWTVLINFLASLDARNPTRMEEHLRRMERIMPDELDKSLRGIKERLENGSLTTIDAGGMSSEGETGIPIPLTSSVKYDENSGKGTIMAELCIGRTTWLYTIMRVLLDVSKILHECKQWTIIKPARGYSWFTSDRPVININCHGSGEYDLEGGWGEENSRIILPVGPEHAVFAAFGESPPPRKPRLTVEETIQVRKLIAENAHRMIFSREKDSGIPPLKPRKADARLRNREKEERKNWQPKHIHIVRRCRFSIPSSHRNKMLGGGSDQKKK